MFETHRKHATYENVGMMSENSNGRITQDKNALLILIPYKCTS